MMCICAPASLIVLVLLWGEGRWLPFYSPFQMLDLCMACIKRGHKQVSLEVENQESRPRQDMSTLGMHTIAYNTTASPLYRLFSLLFSYLVLFCRERYMQPKSSLPCPVPPWHEPPMHARYLRYLAFRPRPHHRARFRCEATADGTLCSFRPVTLKGPTP